MKILMIYPEFPVTFWSYKYVLNLFGIKSLLPPLGFQTVAALLPLEWEKRLVDLNVTELKDSDLEWADYVFISAMIIQKDSAIKVISRCKDFGSKIVAGGPLFSSEYDQFKHVDHFVLSEGELTLPLFINDVVKKELKKVYFSSEFLDLSKSVVPQWDLVDFENYALMGIQYTRGCPYKCEFCYITTLLGNQTRHKTANQIILELDSLYNLGWRRPIFFVDDNFIGNRKHVKTELLPLLIKWQKDKQEIKFRTQASIDLADDDELMQMMVKAGFNNVFIGIETPSDESLDECKKRQNKKRNLIDSVKHIHKSGLQVEGGFIVGFDNDTPSIFQRQIDFIQESGIVTASVGMLNALPGTKLYDRMKKEGRLQGQFSGDNIDCTTNITPKMGLNTLAQGYKKILEDIYSPDKYSQRVMTFLKDFKPYESNVAKQIKQKNIMFRIFYILGIADKDRKYFWKLLFWAIAQRKGLFLLVVRNALLGYHFRKIMKLNTGKEI